MDGFDIRALGKHELSEALSLIRDVFMRFEAPDYSDEGIQEFMDFINPDGVAERIRAGALLMWGCFEGDRLVGVLSLRPPCHISLLFVSGDRHRRGIARALVNEVSGYVRLNGHRAMTVNSSPYAVEAYHRLGFCDSTPEQTVNGIRFTPMSLTL